MYLRNPWDYAFSHLLMASDEPTVQLEFQTPRRVRLSKTKNAWLAEAVLDGVRFDYEDAEFGLICQKLSRSLYVGIFADYALTDFLEGNRHLKPKRDHEGIYWLGQPQTKKAPKPKLNRKNVELAVADREFIASDAITSAPNATRSTAHPIMNKRSPHPVKRRPPATAADRAARFTWGDGDIEFVEDQAVKKPKKAKPPKKMPAKKDSR